MMIIEIVMLILAMLSWGAIVLFIVMWLGGDD